MVFFALVLILILILIAHIAIDKALVRHNLWGLRLCYHGALFCGSVALLVYATSLPA